VTEHIDEMAELYALGSLEDLERARVERHVETCEACAVRLDEASIVVADLAQEFAVGAEFQELSGACPVRGAGGIPA